MNKNLIIYLCALLLLGGCSDDRMKLKGHGHRPITFFEQARQFQFEIDSLPYNSLPNRNQTAATVADTNFPKDSLGIRLFEYEGSTHYHPIILAHRGAAFMTLFEKSGDSLYLEEVKKYVDCLLDKANRFDSALYYPYTFDYKVHQIDEALLKAPWYSGMAQGEILSLLTRLYIAGGEKKYLSAADETFNSFLRLKGEAQPWTVFRDDKNCYWIEEYPTDPPSMTLNGFIFSLYGVYDYYEFTKKPEAKLVLTESLNTLKNYLPYYRRDSLVSFYNLTYRHYAHNYHYIHIRQLEMLYRITGDIFFQNMADSFKVDFNPEKEKLFH